MARGFLASRARQTLLLATGLAVAVTSGANAMATPPNTPTNITIDAQPLATALQAFSEQSGLQVGFESQLAQGIQTQGTKGNQTPAQALSQLLKGTGLEYRFINDQTVVIREKTLKPTAALSGTGMLRLAQSDATQTVPGAPPTATSLERSTESSAPRAPGALEEVLVTAQKRSERLQDVPVPVTAISSDQLVDNNELRLQDYYSSIPGLSLSPGNQGAMNLAIRGISTPGANPTVGVTVDDVPYGGSTLNGGGQMVPDIDPGDLARVEVLRGPQGTLYGASSMGGLLKFVTVDPTTNGVKGSVQAGISSVYNGAELGYNVRGAINLPVNDTLAVRLSAFTHEDPGYIDDPAFHLEGVNKGTAYGGLLSALWRPSETVSLKVSALYQDLKIDGSGDVEPSLGDLSQSGIPGVGWLDRKAQLYSATLKVKLGNVDLTAVTGYNNNVVTDLWDYSYYFRSNAESAFNVAGAGVTDNLRARAFTQEIRLSSAIGERIDWLFGGFYTNKNSFDFQTVPALNADTGAFAGELLINPFPTTYAEFAAFGDVTFHITDRFDVQVGGRGSKIRDTFSQVQSGPLVNGVLVTPEGEAKSSAFTYLLTPRLKLSPELMLYARLASGYRPGGPNQNCLFDHVPCQYDPDKTENYELGVKGDFWDQKLSIDASLYYIDWKNIQLTFVGMDGVTYFANGSAAKSQGLELAVQARPIAGLTLGGWATWDQAVITEPTPPEASQPLTVGERLPVSPRFSANLSAQEDFALVERWSGFVGAEASYVGNRLSAIGASGAQVYPSYTKVDVRAGVRYDTTWTANLFVTNLSNSRGILGGGTGTIFPDARYYIQPRTVGFNIVRAF